MTKPKTKRVKAWGFLDKKTKEITNWAMCTKNLDDFLDMAVNTKESFKDRNRRERVLSKQKIVPVTITYKLPNKKR